MANPPRQRVPENLRKKQERDSKLAGAMTKAREARRKEMVTKKAEWMKQVAKNGFQELLIE